MPRARPKAPLDPSNFGYIESLLSEGNLKGVYVFLMATLDKCAISIDYTAGCIKIWPILNNKPLAMQGIPPDAYLLSHSPITDDDVDAYYNV